MARAYERVAQQKPAPADKAQPGGWTLPPDAEQKKSPLTADAKVLAAGKTVFKNKCQKCHGAGRPRRRTRMPIRTTRRTWI